MIVDEVNIKSFAVREPKDDPPVRAHGERPKAFEVALQGMQPEGRQIEVADTLRRIEQGQNLPDFPHMLCVEPSGVVILVKLSQAPCRQLAIIALSYPSVDSCKALLYTSQL